MSSGSKRNRENVEILGFEPLKIAAIIDVKTHRLVDRTYF